MNLKSRKFLLTCIVLILSIAIIFFKSDITESELELLSKVIYTAIAYILGESYIDSKNIKE